MWLPVTTSWRTERKALPTPLSVPYTPRSLFPDSYRTSLCPIPPPTSSTLHDNRIHKRKRISLSSQGSSKHTASNGTSPPAPPRPEATVRTTAYLRLLLVSPRPAAPSPESQHIALRHSQNIHESRTLSKNTASLSLHKAILREEKRKHRLTRSWATNRHRAPTSRRPSPSSTSAAMVVSSSTP